MMGGEIVWEALPYLAAHLGIIDVELWVEQLVNIRDTLKGVNNELRSTNG